MGWAATSLRLSKKKIETMEKNKSKTDLIKFMK